MKLCLIEKEQDGENWARTTVSHCGRNRDVLPLSTDFLTSLTQNEKAAPRPSL